MARDWGIYRRERMMKMTMTMVGASGLFMNLVHINIPITAVNGPQ